jgi:SOS-response transcriptional repressor LexA
MIDAGIHSGDLRVVDQSFEALDGELTVKRLFRQGGVLRLVPANSRRTISSLTSRGPDNFELDRPPGRA